MGKAKTKDRGYITMKEWVDEWGGKRDEAERKTFSKLPFHYCSISFQPFTTPACTEDGHIFDLMNIVPYIKKHKTHPVTGAPLATKDLIRLNIHKNAQGELSCPVTFKVFTDNVHIVALKNTGNVFSYEAVEQFNLKPKFMFDLVSNEPFTKADIIHLQDPQNIERRNAAQFYHVKHQLSAKSEGGSNPMSSIHTTPAMDRVFAQVKQQTAANSSSLVASSTPRPQVDTVTPASQATSSSDPNMKLATRSYSSGKMSASFTSTAVDVATTNPNIVEQVRRQLKPKKKGYVRVKTSLGDLNIELHCDKAPIACENFILLCERGYYNDVAFHRNIPDFMIQGGDPTGTGRGGDSAFGGTFADEIRETLRHSQRGVVSMANRGPATNTSQFFICYRPARHLDNLHTVFGRVVGGLEVLDLMEKVKVDKNDKPLEDITILSTVVFVNPFDEMLKAEKEATEKKLKETPTFVNESEIGQWFSNPKPSVTPKRPAALVGKYIPSTLNADGSASEGGPPSEGPNADTPLVVTVSDLLAESKKKKPRPNSQFGDFSGW
eukprot:c12228_g1_i5.p1 GENE.c12228_g1_i5~~c12228_g1_i5.p1  ORF type:complete len:562 (-),score=131.38 c12228_g1_i5:205-1854(-)